jgi:hypothetical protein
MTPCNGYFMVKIVEYELPHSEFIQYSKLILPGQLGILPIFEPTSRGRIKFAIYYCKTWIFISNIL